MLRGLRAVSCTALLYVWKSGALTLSSLFGGKKVDDDMYNPVYIQFHFSTLFLIALFVLYSD